MEGNKERFARRTRFGSALLLALCLAAAVVVSASVELARFEATPNPGGGTIDVVWETGSEIDTLAFKLYRSTDGGTQDWGEAIYTVAATNSQTGDTYPYSDAAIQTGILYYYLLEDISTSGTSTRHGPISAGIGVVPVTPSSTPTQQSTATKTRTSLTTATPQTIQATATRRYTNTPAVPTPTPPRNNTAPVQQIPGSSYLATPTLAGFAVVTTPTRVGLAFPPNTLPQSSPLLAPTALAPVTASEPLVSKPATATAVVIARVTAPAGPTRTPLVRASGTPAVFEAVATPGAPDPASEPGSTSSVSAIAVAGSAIVLAAVAGLVIYFVVRGRK